MRDHIAYGPPLELGDNLEIAICQIGKGRGKCFTLLQKIVGFPDHLSGLFNSLRL
jgi:hypothetical protein